MHEATPEWSFESARACYQAPLCSQSRATSLGVALLGSMDLTDQEWGEFRLNTSFSDQLGDYDSEFFDAVSAGGFGILQPEDNAQAGDAPCITIDGYHFYEQYSQPCDKQCDTSYGNCYIQGHAEGSFNESNGSTVQAMGMEELDPAL